MSNGKNNSPQLLNALYSLRSSREVKGSSNCSHLVCRDLGTGCRLGNSLSRPLVPQASLQASSSSLLGRDLDTRVSRRIPIAGAHSQLDYETLNGDPRVSSLVPLDEHSQRVSMLDNTVSTPNLVRHDRLEGTRHSTSSNVLKNPDSKRSRIPKQVRFESTLPTKGAVKPNYLTILLVTY